MIRVFVTGATGLVGSAIVRELINAGHQVLGLTRSEAGAQSLSTTGAEVHRGDLGESAPWSGHVGWRHPHRFNHDSSKFVANCEQDRKVIEAMGDVLFGSDRPLLITSGTGMGTLFQVNPQPKTISIPTTRILVKLRK